MQLKGEKSMIESMRFGSTENSSGSDATQCFNQ